MSDNLDELRKVAEAATPGPWEAEPYLLSRLEQAEQAVLRVRVALTEVQGRGERISEMPNTGSIRSQERAARGTGYLEATRLAFRALDGDGRE